jgi:simple sugar transport system permease protein
LIGKNKDFAELSGINVGKFMLIIAFIAGAFSGLSVFGEVLGVYHRVYNGFSSNLGFYGMTAALIGGDSVFGLIAGALILGALQSGSISLATMTDTQSEIVLVVQGFVMLFATIKIFKHFSYLKNK